MSFLPNQHDEDDDSLSSISSTSPTPVSATMATPPHSPSRSRLLMQKHDIKSPLLSPPKLIIEERHVEPTTYTRRRIERGTSNHNNIPARDVRVSIDMRTRSSRLFFVLLHLVGVSKNVPSSRSTYNRNSSNYRGSDLSSFIQKYSPEWLAWTTGIVGVHPTGILLEKLDIQSSRRGLKGIIERVERVWRWDGNNDLLGEPYWFQTNDGQCLDPSGRFGECGDSTLWRVRRRPLSKRQLREKRYKQRHRQREQERRKEENMGAPYTQRRREYPENSSSVCVWPFFCEENSQFSQQPTNIGYDEVYGFEYGNLDEEEEEGFSLQLIGADTMIDTSFHRVSTDLNGRRRRRFFGKLDNEQDGGAEECLLSFPSSKNGGSILQTGKCTSDAAWTWHVNRDGILVRGSTSAEKRRRQRRWKLSPQRASTAAAIGSRGKSLQSSPSDFGCVHQTNSTVATLLPCGVGSSKKNRASTDSTLVEFSLVRYPTTSYKSIPPQKQQEPAVGNVDEDSLNWEPWITLDISQLSAEEDSQTPEETIEIPPQNLPHSRRSSHSQATAGAKQPTLKSTTNMLHTSLDQGKAKKDVTTSASHIRNAPVAMNGVAFHKQRMMDKNSDDRSEGGGGPSNGPTSTKIRLEKKNKRQSRPSGGQTPIHEDASEGSDHNPDSNPHRPRKIPVHPYIQSSKDFVWVDPLTSLEYPTDLCSYLGQTKSEAGRHTLMGVGQYYRTAFNIKVYGAALYVAKRDVLADPKFGEYATLSADDLRGRDDFYNHLMNMPSPGEDPTNSIGGFFDRTLFIKINMQLSTKAMRQSLEADWSLLTEEMKATIIDSSFEERIADERMKQKIQSKENSSNCSCGQSAPPEYNADPSCCARGTELVFTWRKNGDFEVRLDGRTMDIFPRSDIARGIFAEYLNNNPISLDAKAHFADGFPFLLAPLAQVKGMSSAVPQSHEPAEEKVKIQSTSNNPMHRMMNMAMNSMDTMNNQAQSLSKWMTDGATGMTSNAIGVARGLSEELDKQRIDFVENAVELKNEGMEMITSLMKMSAQDNDLAVALVDNQEVPTISPFDNTYEEHLEIIPDEIGMKHEPTMNLSHSLFFVTVHIYLVLMLLASIPRSKNERYIVRRIKNTRDI